MKEKYIRIIAAIITIALGIIVAVFGPGDAVDLYFGIGFLVTGTVLIILNVINLSKNKQITFGQLFISTAFVTVGITLIFFRNFLSFSMIVNLVVTLVLGMGIALLLYGLFTLLLSKQLAYGIIQMVLGLAVVIFVILYYNIGDFRHVFWIITGILIAAYGVLDLIITLTNKKLK